MVGRRGGCAGGSTRRRRTRLARIAGLLLLAATALLLVVRLATPEPPPLVLLVVFDALRADHLSQYGYALPTSPGLARLTSRATLFRNAYAPASYTTASTASLMTGLSPLRHGARRQGARLDRSPTGTTATPIPPGRQTVSGSRSNPIEKATRVSSGNAPMAAARPNG